MASLVAKAWTPISCGSADNHMRRDAGFTLVEMLIVLAIIAVAAGAVAAGIGSVGRAPSVEIEARRLATRLQLAADEAMLGDVMFAFTVEEDGYGFATIGADGALTARGDDALGFHRLPSGMVVALSVRPPIILGLDGESLPLTATVEKGSVRWQVAFDGLTARVAPLHEPQL